MATENPEDETTNENTDDECTCPDLLNGHYPDCPFLRKKPAELESYWNNPDFDDEPYGADDFGYGDMNEEDDDRD